MHTTKLLRILFCGGIALILTGLIACSEEELVVESGPRPVKMFTVGSSGAAIKLNYPGLVKAAQRTELSFEVAGKITLFNYNEGQLIEQNAVIAQLDATDYQAQFDSVTSQLTAAQSQLVRVEELKERDFASQLEVDQARREMEVLSAQLLQAEKALADSSLRAPFTGRLASKTVEDFANVRAKQQIGLLQDISTLQVTVNVPQNDFRYIDSSRPLMERRNSLVINVSISTFPGREFEASLFEVATTADAQTGTFQTTVEFIPPNDILILPGMTSTVSLSVSGNNSVGEKLSVPTEAVFSNTEGEPVVWVIDAQSMQASLHHVNLGAISGAEIEILSGLNNGDVIATSGVNALSEGMTVTPYRGRNE